uniref:Uncharacterized protein n=1 Tax=Strombidium inclinatum TaxID=197538 RepID=A0A7S3IQV1_9SPIT
MQARSVAEGSACLLLEIQSTHWEGDMRTTSVGWRDYVAVDGVDDCLFCFGRGYHLRCGGLARMIELLRFVHEGVLLEAAELLTVFLLVVTIMLQWYHELILSLLISI